MKTAIRTLMCAAALLGSASSRAVTIADGEIQRLSHVDTVVTGPLAGTYRYEYTLANDSPGPQWNFREREIWPLIIGYELPLDNPAVVSNVTSPATWAHEFLSAAEYESRFGIENPFDSAYVIRWYDTDPPMGQSQPTFQKTIAPSGFNVRFGSDQYEPSLDGFGFNSGLSPVDGPYAAEWDDFERIVGDPPLPGGIVSGGGLPYRRMSLPDVSSGWVLVAIGGLGLALVRRS